MIGARRESARDAISRQQAPLAKPPAGGADATLERREHATSNR